MANPKLDTKDVLLKRKTWERLKIEATRRDTSILNLASELIESALSSHQATKEKR